MIHMPPETEAPAIRIAARTHSTPEAVVREALEAKAREVGVDAGAPRRKATLDELKAIVDANVALPLLDPRTPDEIIDYDAHATIHRSRVKPGT